MEDGLWRWVEPPIWLNFSITFGGVLVRVECRSVFVCAQKCCQNCDSLWMRKSTKSNLTGRALCQKSLKSSTCMTSSYQFTMHFFMICQILTLGLVELFCMERIANDFLPGSPLFNILFNLDQTHVSW